MSYINQNMSTYFTRVFANFRDFYNEINAATLTGAIDVIVVEHPDGTYTCSPFHVRFGKLGVLRSREKVVDIEINGQPADIHMKLGESGEAFFVEESTDSEDIPELWSTSPIAVSDLEELYTAATSEKARRKSIDNSYTYENLASDKLDVNQLNDYKKRRNTGGNDKDYSSQKREFVEKHVNLGNLAPIASVIALSGDRTPVDDNSQSSVNNTSKISDDFRNDDEEVFVMDSFDETTTSEKLELKPKVFHAEKLTQEQSLQIHESNKFAPIKSESNKFAAIKDEAEQAEQTDVESITQPVNDNESRNSKKRRRKKSLLKKRQNKKNDDETAGGHKAAELDDKVESGETKRNSSEFESEDAINDGEVPMRTVNLRDLEIHSYSDTDVAVFDSGKMQRSTSPVQSDSEFEFSQRKGEQLEAKRSETWAWGQLPTTETMPTGRDDNKEESSQHRHSVLGGMFSFISHNKRMSDNAHECVGKYLSELNSLDPEISALYLTGSCHYKHTEPDNDCESGNGPSIPQSPNSVDGAKSVDSDFDDVACKDINKYMRDVSMSLCGWNEAPNAETFQRHLVTFTDLCNDPTILYSQDLVMRMNDKYYNSKVAIPIIISVLVYQKPLPQSTIHQLFEIHNVTKPLDDKLNKSQEQRTYSWWNWRRTKTNESLMAETLDKPDVKKDGKNVQISDDVKTDNFASALAEVSKDVQFKDANIPNRSAGIAIINGDHNNRRPSEEKYRKTLRLTSEQIASLNLKDDANEVEFSVTTAYQGTTRCKCYIYKWRYDDKIVISDIDGTITKSDILGHILPMVGNNWAQNGVAQLFTKINNNGYKMLYLSARAIGQARLTREYLRSVRQGDVSLPDGPILLNPASLMTAFHREVIEKKPEKFKIQCLSDIKALFAADSNPFYAGYGNRINDVWAYRAVGIPIVRIFTINHRGELRHELCQTFQSSYEDMSDMVDQLFPPLQDSASEYSQFNFWREPLPQIQFKN